MNIGGLSLVLSVIYIHGTVSMNMLSMLHRLTVSSVQYIHRHSLTNFWGGGGGDFSPQSPFLIHHTETYLLSAWLYRIMHDTHHSSFQIH